MEKNKKRVFTGTVAMLVILFGLLRIAIFTGYHMRWRSLRVGIWERDEGIRTAVEAVDTVHMPNGRCV